MIIGGFDVKNGLIRERAIKSTNMCAPELNMLFGCIEENDWSHLKCEGYLARLHVCIESYKRVEERANRSMKSLSYQMTRLATKLKK